MLKVHTENSALYEIIAKINKNYFENVDMELFYSDIKKYLKRYLQFHRHNTDIVPRQLEVINKFFITGTIAPLKQISLEKFTECLNNLSFINSVESPIVYNENELRKIWPQLPNNRFTCFNFEDFFSSYLLKIKRSGDTDWKIDGHLNPPEFTSWQELLSSCDTKGSNTFIFTDQYILQSSARFEYLVVKKIDSIAHNIADIVSSLCNKDLLNVNVIIISTDEYLNPNSNTSKSGQGNKIDLESNDKFEEHLIPKIKNYLKTWNNIIAKVSIAIGRRNMFDKTLSNKSPIILHPRMLLTNHYFITSDKGFNDYDYKNKAFKEGGSAYIDIHTYLDPINLKSASQYLNKCKQLFQEIKNNKDEDRKAFFGDDINF